MRTEFCKFDVHAKVYPNEVFVLMLFMMPYSRHCTLVILLQEASVLPGRTETHG